MSEKLTDAERARALARYRSMQGRSVRVGFGPFGPTVEARNPQELEEKTEQALVEMTEGEEAN
jgi:hypothetical protein